MYVCNYCGRYLKNSYDNCPGCGSSSFKKVGMIESYAIKKPPEGGYNIKVDSYEKAIKFSKILKWVGVGLIIFLILFDLPFIFGGLMTMEQDAMFGTTFIVTSVGVSAVFYAIAIGIIVASRKSKKKNLSNIERVKKLSKTGVLIKNMPYELKETGTIINGTPVYRIEVQYESKSGKLIPLSSEPKYNNVLGNENGTADLLIDPNDFSNYYIDFEIY